jgi:hypothetical protein
VGGFCTAHWDSDPMDDEGSETCVGTAWKRRNQLKVNTTFHFPLIKDWIPQKFQYPDTVQLLNQYVDTELQEVLFV